MARYPIGCGSSSVRGMLLSVSKCRTLLSVLSFSLSHSVGYTSVGWLGRDSDSILYNTNSSHAPLAQTTVGWLGRDSDSILYNTNSSHAPLAQTTGDRRRAGRYRRQADSRQTGGEWADTDCTSGTSVSCNKCNTLLTLILPVDTIGSSGDSLYLRTRSSTRNRGSCQVCIESPTLDSRCNLLNLLHRRRLSIPSIPRCPIPRTDI